MGYEVLESEGTDATAFRTPLATLHAFNGWGDLFLNTPAGGIEDTYLKVTAPIPGGVKFLGFYHKFEAENGGADYGDEIDLQFVYALNKNLSFTAKAAFYDADATTGPLSFDTDKYWLQADYSF